ncbi:MAG: phenylacetate--CoA ligase [Candidatus Tectomicrobia bacterium]|nr:phenylacetate--CoA ligase [Candidatus Tectomicrobia bacterium]MBI3075773.1 phenylacetate--CoA ligase [Deltaproteobacteria bacterium]
MSPPIRTPPRTAQGEFYEPQVEQMPREALEALQLERLRAQLRRCDRRAPFYREKWQRAGVRPDDLRTLADLRHFPVVTKQELREEQQAHPPFGRYTVAPARVWREVHPSTGTTGHPVHTIWSARDVATITRFTARTMWSFGVRPGDIVQNAFAYGLWIAGLAVHYAAAEIGCLVIPIGAGLTNRQLDYLVSPGATVLLATPSYALHIAEALRERGTDPEKIALRRGCFGGEAGTEAPATRAKIEKGLGIDAYDYYGLSEIAPTFASECTAKAGLHWSEDDHLIEVLDPETQVPLPPGQLGVLVITHLTREACPMVRYWTGDYARLDLAPCACGRTHARSPGGIVGRADDMVIYRGAKFYPVQVEKVVRSFPELGDEFRIELTAHPETGADVCTVVAELASETVAPDAMRETLRRALREELLVAPEVRLVTFGTLERTTFKAKRIDDRRRPAAT